MGGAHCRDGVSEDCWKTSALMASHEVGGSEEGVGHKPRKGREHTRKLRVDTKDETKKIS